MIADGLRLAVGTLTVLRVPPPSHVDRSVARVAMALGWLAVVPLATVVGLVCRGGTALDAPPLLVAGAALALLALGSRGLHLDGLADTVDGLASSHDPERALRVMRTGDVGPAGAATLVLTLLVQAAAVAALLDQPLLVAGAVVASRALLVTACADGVPSARPEGLGATVGGSVPVPLAVAVLAVVAALVAGAGAAGGAGWWVGPAGLLGALVTGAVVLARCVRRVGGVTGDVLGAVVELGLAGFLAVAAVAV